MGGKQILSDSLFCHSLYKIYDHDPDTRQTCGTDNDFMCHDMRQFARTVRTIAFVNSATPYINF